MRFNGKELSTIAVHPPHKFDKEGVLRVTEKQEGLFRNKDGELFIFLQNLRSFIKPFKCIQKMSLLILFTL